ncbi:unnamed protein product [Spirodela intermedia]|uniref:non-specific serine/threonine protein kinase n=1 Tax=Spirodela intermedia TaxID=51605 RepID=A0A7I8IZN8_SPIIN|nr:unnamed protein product [Spirodela intermedia]CAA6663347.1 unnamed protein product [Spirodela intermedia]
MEPTGRGVSRNVDNDGEVLEADPTGRYVRYKEILGKGSFKTVYRAFDEVEGREVAWNQVKIDDALRSPEDLERLYSEVHLLKSLQHENIIQYLNSWVDDQKKTINIITELFTSGSLRQYRKKYTNVDMKAVKSWARQILRGLQYLHTHNPPILHRDLKCDNILVNGNKGEVKIGDLGLAIIMQRPNARSIIGTPEFMAPELYEEEYNQLVDVYSFGMCLLEMVTLEYPYSECKNAAQIYKKVTSGIKPLALGKVADPQVKQLIEKCLLPASERSSVKELLQDPLFRSDISRSVQDPIRSSEKIEYEPMDEVSYVQPSNNRNTETNFEDPWVLSMEFQKTKDQNEFTLRGEKIDNNTISFILRILNREGEAKNIHFTFYLDSDTAISVTREMVEHLSLSNCDDTFIANFIDFSVTKLILGWSPSACEKARVNEVRQVYTVNQWSGPRSSDNTDIDADDLIFSHLTLGNSGENSFQGAMGDVRRNPGGYLALERVGGHDGNPIAINHSTDSLDTFMSEIQDPANVSSIPTDSSLASSVDSSHDVDLKMELETLEVQYQQKLQELSRMQARALDDARRRYFLKKKI